MDGSPLVLTVDAPLEAWNALKAEAVQTQEDGFRAYLAFFDEPRFLGVDEAMLRAEFEPEDVAVIFVADAKSFEGEPSVLAIDIEGLAPSFWVRMPEMWVVENNVSIGNLLFEELAEEAVDGWYPPFQG